jgi:SOS-response transcriptional repressors (recA-mediated autopeptidases)
MSIAENIKRIRLEHGLSQAELGKIAGVSDKAVSTWELGIKVPRMGAVEKMATYFGIAKSVIVDDAKPADPSASPTPIPPGFQPMPAMDTVPLVGRIACGTPITAEQNVECMVCVPSNWRATFTLTCKGNSMEPRIHDGDLVAIRSQREVENGEIAAVRIDGEATLKHVYLHDSFIELRPENPAFNSIILSREDMNNVVIEGKAVGLCRDI